MIGLIPPDRWTCPNCRVTEVVDTQSLEETQELIRRVQLAHAREHAGEVLSAEDCIRRQSVPVGNSNAGLSLLAGPGRR